MQQGRGKKIGSSNILRKVPTGIGGFDEITGGGLPAGRTTLVCGALEFNEPGVLMTFEETSDDIKKNVSSLGFNIDDLVARKKLVIDYVRVERSEIEENGEYD